MILVLDNCSPKIHEDFLRECSRTGSNITLVSIDYEKVNNPLLNEYTIIELKDHDYKSVTKDVLNNQYKQILSDQDIDYLMNFSEGNTKMAIDFAEASIKEIQLNQTLNRELIKKLIYGRDDIIEDEFEILKILSVFKAFEFPDTSYYSIDNNHYNQLLENVKFISEYFSIDIKKVKKTINKFIRKGSIERRGHFIILRPTPLALKLSLLFWEDFPPENYSNFIEAIPSQMRKELTLQLERVGNVKEAKEVVTTIWGLNGNFSTAEMLNSNSGSLLFRSIVNVNPIEAVKVLKKNYLNKTTEELTEIVDSRQNLVWALEKLCFRKETFSDASKVLMSFAVAEIETFYSNNSTSYFKQLFHLYLAGTEVNFNSRLKTLYWALEKNDSDFDLMVIKACKSALSGIHNNVRMLGAENQGSQLPLKEYQPENLLEIHDYINNILIILKRLQSNYLNEINKLIRLSLYFFIEINYNFNELKSFFEYIIENKESKHEFRKTLIGIRSNQSQNQNPSQIEIVDEFISKTEPQTIEEQIKDIVSTPKYTFSKDREIDISKEKSEAFAKKIINEGIDLKKYLSNLFLGEQYQTFNFGKKYAELKGFEEPLLDEIIIFLINLNDDDNWNISFLHGYLSEFSAEIKKHVFYKFLEKKSKISFLLFRNIGSNLNDALKLIELITIDNQKNLTQIGYGLLSFNIEDFITFLNKLNPILENKSPLLDFIYNYLNTNNTFKHNEAVLQWLNKLMDKHNLLENVNNSYHLDYYYWQKTMEKMLLTNPSYVTSIAEQIIAYHKANFTSFTSDIHITKIAMLTLEINFELAWNNYSKLLIDEDDYLYFHTIFDFGLFSSNKTNIFFSNKERNKKILNWFKLNPETAKKIIKNAPLFSDSGGWFDFTFKMIIEFGDKKEFLDELSSNFHSMITSGSRVPYLESRKKLLKKLLYLNIPELTIWTENQIDYFDRKIKIEKIRNEQKGLR